jgi:hypothetical protein
MSDQNLVNPVVRVALFSRAKTLTDTVSERLKDAKSFLEQDNEDGVLGSLEGIESDLLTITCLMSLCQDFKRKE